MELLARRTQMIEPKYKDRVLPKPTKDMDNFNDSLLHLGTSETHGSLMVCLALEKRVGEPLHFESFAAKERRKAAEVRSGAGAKKRLQPCLRRELGHKAEHATRCWKWMSGPEETRRAARSSARLCSSCRGYGSSW